ncbi:hypothetical protein [Thalassobaculum litoreum]|uniref:Uncharacterized protein n=1 Tax=Thalassobaculum litoreum DSM 18839 TaxID=1123362 RepID=A0A8G2F0F3_9PROT|nr:hypothetical protein [Thalassobaculum litoreum]SDG62899.1 hypothetical protein SAMN05660686_05069 [Thalassobaculum litoreum DSM 18839]
MSIQEILHEEWRIAILTSLKALPGSVGYEGLLQKLVASYHHYYLTRDEMQSELRWLRDAGLVRLHDNVTPSRITYTATLSDKGLAVAEGRLRAAGVRLPGE